MLKEAEPNRSKKKNAKVEYTPRCMDADLTEDVTHEQNSAVHAKKQKSRKVESHGQADVTRPFLPFGVQAAGVCMRCKPLGNRVRCNNYKR